MLTIQVLKRARKLLRKGWCQGDPVRRDERMKPIAYCILGATSFASRGHMTEARHRAKRRIHEVLPVGSISIVDFNDKPGRTKAQVLEVMDAAIKLEEAGLPWWQRVLP